MSPLVEEMVRPGMDETQAEGTHSDRMLDSIEKVIQRIREVYMKERLGGYTHAGKSFPPISTEEAEQRWSAMEPSFRKQLMSDAADVKTNLGIYRDVPAAVHSGPSGGFAHS